MILTQRAFGLNSPRTRERADRAVAKVAYMMGLSRVAGNTFVCESTKDFWRVSGNRIVRLVGNEVDYGDKLVAAPEANPAEFLDGILGDLEFD